MNKYFLTFIYIVAANFCIAQTQKSKFKFQSINTLGSVFGANQTVVSFSSVNGFTYNKWFVGIGASLDGYGSQSIPVFVDVRKTIGEKFFIYGDAGINNPLRTSNFPKIYEWNGMDAYDLKTSFYGECGIGLESKINNSTKVVASIGLSHKTFNYTMHNVYTWMSPNTTESVDYFFTYNRLACRIGFIF